MYRRHATVGGGGGGGSYRKLIRPTVVEETRELPSSPSPPPLGRRLAVPVPNVVIRFAQMRLISKAYAADAGD